MATKQEMQRAIYGYKNATGQREVDLHDVARWAVSTLGWRLPIPISPIDRLAKDFARAAREEIRIDKKTKKPYRANHAVPTESNGQTVMRWVDIDEAPRKPMHRSLQLRREQMVGDGFQLSLDADHWNSINACEEPIEIVLDFTDDVAWRKAAPDEDEAAV